MENLCMNCTHTKIQKCVKRLFIPYTEFTSDFFMFTRYSRDRKTHASKKIIQKNC